MNVNDIKTEVPQTDDKLASIFAKQRSLMEKYEGIEKSNGLLQTDDIPVNLDDNKGQARLKDFFWRTTEEIAEAIEAYYDDQDDHFKEELSDALHFLVETMILSGIDHNQLVISDKHLFLGISNGLEALFDRQDTLDESHIKQLAADVIIWMGLAANCLKNKPWKQSHMKTDQVKYVTIMIEVFESFIRLCKCAGFDADSLYAMYFKKNEVNKFRQESKY